MERVQDRTKVVHSIVLKKIIAVTMVPQNSWVTARRDSGGVVVLCLLVTPIELCSLPRSTSREVKNVQYYGREKDTMAKWRAKNKNRKGSK